MALLEVSDVGPAPSLVRGEGMEDVALEDSAGPGLCVDFWRSGADCPAVCYKDTAPPHHILVSHHQVQRQHTVMRGSVTVSTDWRPH